MSNELATIQPVTIALPTPVHALAEAVDREIQVMRAHLHPSVHPVQWMASALTEVNKLKPDVSPQSVMESLEKLALTGLYLGGAFGHAYLVPYKGKCTLQIGYKGFVELAMGNGSIIGVSADVILSGEVHSLVRDTDAGSVAKFRHEVPMNRDVGSIKTIEAAYCIYETSGGFKDVVTVGKAELVKLHNSSQESSPWRSRYEAMCKKTPVRRASKLWRQTKELAAAVEIDEESERLFEKPPFEAPSANPAAPKALPRGERVTTENLKTLYRAYLKFNELTDSPEVRQQFRVWQSTVSGIPPESCDKLENWSQLKLAECLGRLA